MTKINQQFLYKKCNLTPVADIPPYRVCKLRDYDKSLDKVWHVEYYIFDQKAQKLVRRRVILSRDNAKLSLDVPEDGHLKVRRLQLDEEIAGKKINLRDLYNELIELGLEAKEKAAQK